MDHICLICL